VAACHRALEAGDDIYLLNRGRIEFSGAPSKIDEGGLHRRYLDAHHAPHANGH
jgi:hypothetical protein